MSPYAAHKPAFPLALRRATAVCWVLCAGLCAGLLAWPGTAKAQIIDENTPFLAPFPSVGETGTFDFLAQSFIADISRAYRVGVWLRADAGGGEVQLALYGSNANGEPDSSQILHQSSLVAPSTGGGWVYDSGFVAAMQPGAVYWVVVDGYQTISGTGASSVGVSNVFTDTQLPLYGSVDGGFSWQVALGNPMAVFVEGDTCNFSVNFTPLGYNLCPGQTVTLQAPPGYAGYIWSTGATTSAIQTTSTGFYDVTIINSSQCRTSATLSVAAAPDPVIGLAPIVQACEGVALNLSVFPVYTTYLWSTGGTSESITINTTGLYWIEVVNAFGCVGRDTSIVTFYPVPRPELGSDTTLCDGQFIQLDAGPGFAGYQWSNGGTGRSIFVDATGDYSCLVTDVTTCVGSTDTISVQVFPNPPTPSITQTLSGISASFGFSYAWLRDGQPLSVTTQDLPEPSPGSYEVIVTNGFGCPARSEPFVIAAVQPGSFISEGFSPNGDGLNEVFYVEGIENYPANRLLVFNRWGDEVFRKSNYSNDWHGLGPGGKPLPDGDYYYVLELGPMLPTREGAVVIHR